MNGFSSQVALTSRIAQCSTIPIATVPASTGKWLTIMINTKKKKKKKEKFVINSDIVSHRTGNESNHYSSAGYKSESQ